MRRKRGLISAAAAVAVIATGTAAAAANFGLLGTNDTQLPAGHLDLATVQTNIHLMQAGGSEVTVVPPSTEAGDDRQPTTTLSPADTAASTAPVNAPRQDDDRGDDLHGGYDDD